MPGKPLGGKPTARGTGWRSAPPSGTGGIYGIIRSFPGAAPSTLAIVGPAGRMGTGGRSPAPRA
jgi:hypothetical protein